MSKALLAKVHIAKKELKLVDESYRAILARVTGKDSAASCDVHQLEAILAEFRRLGWKPKTAVGSAYSNRPYVRKVYAVWREAGQVGAVTSASKDALRAFVRRQTGKDAPEFLSPAQANSVTEALKAMIARAPG